MKIADLLKAIQFHGELTHVDLDVDVQGIVEHSSASSKDMIYACLGSIENAQSYIEEALKKGVMVFLVSPEIAKLALKIKPSISLIISPLPRLTFAKIVSCFYTHSIDIVAVTGTNGKSSTVNFYRQIARALNVDAASLGTLGVFRDEKMHLPFANLTTLLPTDLHKTLALLSKDGVTHLALEASSHGLDQYRLHGIQLKAAAFTNFTQDHLDYHLTMENYFLAKMKVFEDILAPDGVAVLNADIPEYERIQKIVDDKNIKSLSYGKNGKDIKLLSTHKNGAKTELRLEILGKVYETEIYIFGDFQVYNLLATVGLLIATSIGDVPSILKQFPHLKGADGRMELIGTTSKGGFVIVDFAHTPDALQNVLSSAKNGLEGKLWVVFGCGGNRDALKRPIMGSIASKYADHVIVTDDNPRFEEAHLIRQQVLEGAPNALEMGNRFDAISYAIEHLEKDDVLIIAGKGHETGQIIQDQVLPFNDAEVAHSLIKKAL